MKTNPETNTMSTPYTPEPQDQADHDLGIEIARVLQLKRKRKNGRIETTHGDKNPCGLARTVRALSASHLEKAAPDLLAALELTRGNVSSLNASHPAIYGEWLKVIDAAIAKAGGAK